VSDNRLFSPRKGYKYSILKHNWAQIRLGRLWMRFAVVGSNIEEDSRVDIMMVLLGVIDAII